MKNYKSKNTAVEIRLSWLGIQQERKQCVLYFILVLIFILIERDRVESQSRFHEEVDSATKILNMAVGKKQYQRESRRILGDYKLQYCTGMFFQGQYKATDGEIFDIQQLVTETAKKEAVGLRKTLLQMRGYSEDNLKQALKGHFDSYQTDLIILAVPFLIFGSFMVLGFLCYIFHCCCQPCCPPFQVCRRNAKKDPYLGWEINFPAASLIFFGIVILGGITFGFLVQSQLPLSLKVIRCSVMAFLDQLIFGTVTNSNTWLGLNKADVPIKNLLSELEALNLRIQEKFSDVSWISEQKLTLQNSNQFFYTYYSDKNIQFSPQSQSLRSVPSLYIQKYLGPTTQVNTTSYQVNQVLENSTDIISSSIDSLQKQASSLLSNYDPIKFTFTTAYEQAVAISSISDKFIVEYDNYIENTPTLIIGYIQNFLNIVLGGGAVGVLFSIFGTVLTHFSQIRPMRFCIHGGWCLLSIVGIIAFFLMALILPLSVATSEVCEWLDKYLSTKDQFTNQDYVFAQSDIIEKLTICLFEDGDLTQAFNFNVQLAELINLNGYSQQASLLSNKDTTTFIDTSKSDKVFQSEIDSLQLKQTGQVIDSDGQDFSNHYLSISNLVLWADSSASGSYQSQRKCFESKDQWVFVKEQCPQNYPLLSEADQKAVDQAKNYQSENCIIITSLTPLQVSQRYVSIQENCDPFIFKEITQNHASLYRHQIARQSFYENIIGTLNSIKDFNKQFSTKLGQFLIDVTTFNGQLQNLRDVLYSQDQGLQTAFNCKFLKINLNRVKDGICISFISAVFQIILALGISAFALIFCAFLTFCVVYRISKNPRVIKKQEIRNDNENEQQALQNEEEADPQKDMQVEDA